MLTMRRLPTYGTLVPGGALWTTADALAGIGLRSSSRVTAGGHHGTHTFWSPVTRAYDCHNTCGVSASKSISRKPSGSFAAYTFTPADKR